MGNPTIEQLAEHRPLDFSQCRRLADCKVKEMLTKQGELWEQHLKERTSQDPAILADAEKAKSEAEELGKKMRATLSQCQMNGDLPLKGPQTKARCKI